MVDRPILFSAPMVRPLLNGTKTETRRIAKITAVMGNRVPVYPPEELIELQPGEFRQGMMHYLSTAALSGPYDIGFAVDDRLWVRESYYQRGHWEPVEGAQTKGGRQKWAFIPADCFYTFDEPTNYRKGRHHKDPATVAWHKRLGRFMPRSFSRLTLTVTDVRVERLQAISEADAIAEGIEDVTREVACGDPALRFWKRYRDGGWNGYVDTAVGSYASLWTEINGPGAWEANPWVVAITFTVGHHNIDAGGEA